MRVLIQRVMPLTMSVRNMQINEMILLISRVMILLRGKGRCVIDITRVTDMLMIVLIIVLPELGLLQDVPSWWGTVWPTAEEPPEAHHELHQFQTMVRLASGSTMISNLPVLL